MMEETLYVQWDILQYGNSGPHRMLKTDCNNFTMMTQSSSSISHDDISSMMFWTQYTNCIFLSQLAYHEWVHGKWFHANHSSPSPSLLFLCNCSGHHEDCAIPEAVKCTFSLLRPRVQSQGKPGGIHDEQGGIFVWTLQFCHQVIILPVLCTDLSAAAGTIYPYEATVPRDSALLSLLSTFTDYLLEPNIVAEISLHVCTEKPTCPL